MQTDGLGELLDITRVGVIQLDRLGRIVEANDSAQELLRLNDGLFSEAGALCAALPDDNARLEDLLARALPLPRGQGASGSMTVGRPTLRPGLALHVNSVASREWTIRHGACRRSC